jgi:pimeloyl-ACP methyl ester carboxylesterase
MSGGRTNTRRGIALTAVSAFVAFGGMTLLGSGCGGADQLRPTARWSLPSGPYQGRSPRAVVMLIHGGGWRGLNREALAGESSAAAALTDQGFATMSVDYRGGKLGIRDLDGFYRNARNRMRRTPVCAVGASAGGHLALMLAVRHPSLSCAVSLAGPTDLPALARQPGGQTAYQLAVAAFGRRGLGRFSPALHTGAIRAPLLLIYATNDPYVPLAQGRQMAAAAPGARLIVLRPGAAGFVHSTVNRSELLAATRAESRFLAEAAASHGHGR